MNSFETVKKAQFSYIHNHIYIIISFLIYVLSNGEWNIPIFAWVYPALFLGIGYFVKARGAYFAIVFCYALGFVIQFGKVIGMNIEICIIAGVLLALLKAFPYLYWEKSQMRFQDTIIFASIMVLIEYIIYLIYLILGGLSDAYTQFQNLYLLQVVTATGVYGITFIMYWTAAAAIWIWNNRSNQKALKKYITVFGSVMGLVFVYGVVMYHFAGNPEESIRIAGVTVPVSPLLNEDEAALLRRASTTAKEEGIYLVVSLLVKTPYESLKDRQEKTM